MAIKPISELSDAELDAEVRRLMELSGASSRNTALQETDSRNQLVLNRYMQPRLASLAEAGGNQRLAELQSEVATNPVRSALNEQWAQEAKAADAAYRGTLARNVGLFGAGVGGAALAGGFAGAGGMAAMPGATPIMAPTAASAGGTGATMVGGSIGTGGALTAGPAGGLTGLSALEAGGTGLATGGGATGGTLSSLAAGGGALGTGLTGGQLALGLGGIGATLYGTQQNKKAAEEAAKASAAATQGATALQGEMFNQTQANQRPWLEAGTRALGRQEALLNDPSLYQQDPYNAWLQEQGAKQLDRSASSRGQVFSGGALKELTKYGQGMAGQGFSDQYNRLATLSGTGQAGASNMAGQANQYAQNVGNLNMQNAATQGNLSMARAGQNNQMLSSLLNTGAGMYGMYNQNQQNQALINALQNRY